MGGSIIVLFLLPFIYSSEIRNTTYRPIFKFFYWLFVSDFIILICLGQRPVKDTFVIAGQIATLYYFLFFTLGVGLIGKLESKLVTYNS